MMNHLFVETSAGAGCSEAASSSTAASSTGASAGGSSTGSAAAASSATGSAAAVSSVSGVVSSGIISSGMRARPLLGKRVEELLDGAAHDEIDDPEIGREREYRHDHDAGSRAHLLPGRPGDPLHLELQLL